MQTILYQVLSGKAASCKLYSHHCMFLSTGPLAMQSLLQACMEGMFSKMCKANVDAIVATLFHAEGIPSVKV